VSNCLQKNKLKRRRAHTPPSFLRHRHKKTARRSSAYALFLPRGIVSYSGCQVRLNARRSSHSTRRLAGCSRCTEAAPKPPFARSSRWPLWAPSWLWAVFPKAKLVRCSYEYGIWCRRGAVSTKSAVNQKALLLLHRSAPFLQVRSLAGLSSKNKKKNWKKRRDAAGWRTKSKMAQ
jgi:hypothetical protein